MAQPLLFVNATVIDAVGGVEIPGRDILIVDGTIASIEPTGTALSPDADAIDATGRFVIPGLLDMHAHPLNQRDPERAMALMLLYGVTGFRQMSGTDELLSHRAGGTLRLPTDAPELLATPGPILTAANAATPDAAVAEVARQQAAGADFIKIAAVSTDVYRAVQTEANRLGIPVVGHLPSDMDAAEASAAGIRCIEHLGPGMPIVAAASPEQAQLLAETPPARLRIPTSRPPALLRPLVDRLVAGLIARIVLNPALRTTAADLDTLQEAIDTFDEDRARELARRFAADGTWHCPTLVRVKGQELCGDRDFEGDPDLRFIDSATRGRWLSAAKRFRRRFDAAQREVFAAQYALQLRLVRIFEQEGVSIIAGTDAVGAVWVVPGASLHREFDELTAAGLSPLRVLQTATSDAARFLGRDDLGRVAPGFRADLVLLDQNPLEDAHNLRSITGVVRAGRYLDETALLDLHTSLIRQGVPS